MSGSLRAQSSNSRLLRVAQTLAPANLEITFYEALGELPHFNPDLDTDSPPPAVVDLRESLQRAHGAWICTPEYAHGLPGSFKNALDWTVSSGAWMNKPVLILKSSRSHFAHDSLVETLSTLMAEISVCPLALAGNSLSEVEMAQDPKIASTIHAAIGVFTTEAGY